LQETQEHMQLIFFQIQIHKQQFVHNHKQQIPLTFRKSTVSNI